MTVNNLFLLLVTVGTAFCNAETVTLSDRKVGLFRSVVIVAESPRTIEDLFDLYQQCFDSSGSVFQLQVFPSKETAIQLLGGKLATDRSEVDWLKQYAAVKSSGTVKEMSEIVRVGSDVVGRMSVNHATGEAVLRGKDPLKCEAQANTCEIIWISVGRVPPSEAKYSEPTVNLFLVMGRLPTLIEARKIFGLLRERFPTKLLTVSLRRDPWFIDDLAFPVVYPFILAAPAVSLGETNPHEEITCLENKAEVQCR